jgi:hypothetical protein
MMGAKITITEMSLNTYGSCSIRYDGPSWTCNIVPPSAEMDMVHGFELNARAGEISQKTNR